MYRGLTCDYMYSCRCSVNNHVNRCKLVLVTLDEVRHLTRHSSNWSLTDFDIILGTEEPSFKMCSSNFFCRKIEMKGQVIYHFLAKNKLHVKLLCLSLGPFLWDVPHQYQCSEITWVMVDQMNRWILVEEWIHQFIWSTMIQVITDHWSWSESSQRNAPFICMYVFSESFFLNLRYQGSNSKIHSVHRYYSSCYSGSLCTHSDEYSPPHCDSIHWQTDPSDYKQILKCCRNNSNKWTTF